ncbi:GNAT family N-acetyltransferase [Paenibacillus sp. NPDC058177]|uniref:GNAT family N-acetyltransferase n=1 Tax=Paenibacillus sp. NPDC058177 TaxID=3346369 RepID=UPI0036DAD5BC
MNTIRVGTQSIETERLSLRQFVLEDAEDMFMNWINDKEVQFNYGEPIYETLDAVKENLSRWISSYSRNDFYKWAIILKESNKNIGQIAFCGNDLKHHYADIEYCISRSYQGKGYATEALNAIIEFTFEKTGIYRLQAFHRGDNVASGRVLQKSKMIYEGTLRQSFYYEDENEYDDRVYYGIIKTDFFQK